MGNYSAPRPHGYGLWAGEGRDLERDSLRCCHCGTHFWVTPGSGKARGFCTRCGAVTCGAPTCAACVPLEQQLENKEQGNPLDHVPIVGRVEAEPPRSPGGLYLG